MDLLRAYLRVETKPVRLFALSSQASTMLILMRKKLTLYAVAVLLANRKGLLADRLVASWMAAQNLAQQLDGTVNGLSKTKSLSVHNS